MQSTVRRVVISVRGLTCRFDLPLKVGMEEISWENDLISAQCLFVDVETRQMVCCKAKGNTLRASVQPRSISYLRRHRHSRALEYPPIEMLLRRVRSFAVGILVLLESLANAERTTDERDHRHRWRRRVS